MRLYPSKKFPPFYLTLILVFIANPDLYAAESGLTQLQRQARLYRNYGLELQNRGNIDAALDYYQKAILLDPNFAIAYNDSGIIFEAKGYPKKAEEVYLKAIEIEPDYLSSYSNLALLYEGEGDYANAILYWLKRALLGYLYDPWTETAHQRIESITKTHPEDFKKIQNQYRENLKQLRQSQTSLAASPASDLSQSQLYAPSQTQETDNKASALEHLASAKDNYARGEYVAALKEATTAEYLDSSNKEISAFVEKIRQALLQ